LEMFRDEFIGELLKALPHPSLNYDRWLIELDPKEQQRRELYGDPPPPPKIAVPAPEAEQHQAGETNHDVTHLPSQQVKHTPITGLRSGTLTGTSTKPEPAPDINAEPFAPALSSNNPSLLDGDANRFHTRTETQPDLYGGPVVFSGDPERAAGLNLFSALNEPADEHVAPASSVAFAAVGLEPVSDIWHIPALQDDIEHLQDMAYRLAFELAEAMGCANAITETKGSDTAGYAVTLGCSDPFVDFLSGLTGVYSDKPFNMFAFCVNFFGSPAKTDTPVFNDVHVVKVMRLFRVLRRLRQLQRDTTQGGPDVI